MRKLFSRLGGKRASASVIVPLIPEHDIYVEPFAGGASIYFKKKPSKHEVLADTDKGLIDAYKAVKKLNAMEANKFDYNGNKDKFDKLKASKPTTPAQVFYRYAYMNYNSFSGKNKNYSGATADRNSGSRENKFGRIEEYQDRMKNTIIKHQGYEATIKQYDSPRTVFYLDPPYYNTDRSSYEGMTEDFDWDKFAEVVKGIKGKWMLSTNPDKHVRDLFKGYKMRSIVIYRAGVPEHDMRLGGGVAKHRELLITNF